MKKLTNMLIAAIAVLLLQSCQKDTALNSGTAISADVLQEIKDHGFSTANVVKVDEGYLVESDIILTPAYLGKSNSGRLLRTANAEQYRTTELVRSLPRNIKIKVSDLGASYVQGADIAIARYNAQGLQLTFTRITTGSADINITGFVQGPSGGFITLATSGFPSGGNPYNSIKVNTHRLAYGTSPNATFIGSVLQHEIGHCIGFRHTDYMNRSYSCGGSAVNEGASTMGAILIDGTPAGPDPNSWMLACSNGTDRTFNANDLIALNFLY